jgi:hypothetical protein
MIYYVIDEVNYFRETDQLEIEADSLQEAIAKVKVICESGEYFTEVEHNAICIIDFYDMVTVFIYTKTKKTITLEFQIKKAS